MNRNYIGIGGYQKNRWKNLWKKSWVQKSVVKVWKNFKKTKVKNYEKKKKKK